MTINERIRAVLAGKPVDRLPIRPHRIDPLKKQYTHPSYDRLVELVKEKCDPIHEIAPYGAATVWMFGKAQMESASFRDESGIDRTTVKFNTPGGPFSYEYACRPGNMSAKTKRVIETDADFERWVNADIGPVAEPDPEVIQTEIRRCGQDSIVMLPVASPAGAVADYMLGSEEMAIWSITRPEDIFALVEPIFKRTMRYIEQVLEAAKPHPIIVWLGECEMVAPPLLSPEWFRRLVVPYDGEIIKMVHAFGSQAIVHCHGKQKQILDHLADTGTDGLHPLETLPIGDITLREGKERIGDRMTIIGTVQYDDIARAPHDKFRKIVEEVVAEGTPRGRFILSTTASPYESVLTDHMFENYRTLIEIGRGWKG